MHRTYNTNYKREIKKEELIMKAGINLITFGKMKLKDMGKDASAIGFIGIPDGEIKIPIEK